MDKIKSFEPLFGVWYAEKVIGEGSYGKVYRAYRDELGERYYSAIKYISIPKDEAEVRALRSEGMNDISIESYYNALVRDVMEETRLMNRLKGYSNIVSYEDSRVFQRQNGFGYDVFIRMELLESLTERVEKQDLTQDEIIALGIDICTALEVCGEQGVIHRDIKPANILINSHGDYKLGDFGIARKIDKTTAFMSKKGTENYMAPEVYKGEMYGASCDIYSLGLVMYRLLNNGRLPFLPVAPYQIDPEDRERAIVRRMSGERIPAPCGADAWLSAIVLKACAFDPRERFRSAQEMKTALQNRRLRQTDNERKPGAEAPAPRDPREIYGRAGVGTPDPVPGPIRTGAGAERPVDNNKTKKKKTGLIIGLAAAALWCIVGIIAFLGLFTKGDKEDNGKEGVSAPTLAPDVQTDPNAPVKFYDPAFETALRTACEWSGDIYMEDLDEFISLDLSSAGLNAIPDITKFKNLTSLCLDNNSISDLSVLKYLPELTELSICGNGISDISVFEELTGLTWLDLSDNAIADISPLKGLTELTYLDLGMNSIMDITPLKGMTKLTDLGLYDNKIGNISSLKDMTEMKTLFIGKNSISDISALKGMTRMEELGLNENSISDIAPLKGMTGLTWLSLTENEVSDIAPLKGMTGLTELYLGSNKISSVSALSGMTKLTSLGLYENNIADVSALKGLTALTELGLADNSISDISALKELTALVWLDIGSNSVSSVSALKNMSKLTYLSLESNKISSISALKGLTELEELYLGTNEIEDISALAGMTKLTSLSLCENRISDISMLKNMKKLTWLLLYDNQIGDISPLKGLNGLTTLGLGSNRISDITPLKGMTELTELGFYENQISDISVLKGMTKLSVLGFFNNNVSDISVLEDLAGLTWINLSGNPVDRPQIDRLQQLLPDCEIIY